MRKLGMLQSMGSQRVGHNLVTDKQQQTLSTLGFSHWENACKLLLTVLSWKWHSKKMERDWLERIRFWKRNPDHMNGGHETEGNLTVSVLPRVWVSYFVKDSWRLSSRIILERIWAFWDILALLCVWQCDVLWRNFGDRAGFSYKLNHPFAGWP